MAHFLLLCLILTNGFVVLAMANEKSPALSPSSDKAKAPVSRKFGKHNHKMVNSYGGAPSFSPSESPTSSESSEQENGVVKEQEFHLKKHHHHSVDKSVAGGGVILGGLATTFLVAIFCYIRATGRRNAEINA